MTEMASTLAIHWSRDYRPEWDSDAAAYVAAGLVGWGRSRRLARADDPTRNFKAYMGVHHSDPGQWGRAEPPRAAFFLSLFLGGRTVTLRTFATVPEALMELHAFYERLRVGGPASG